MTRRWRHLPARRGKYWQAGTPASPAAVPPQFMRQAGTIRFAARLLPSRRRWYDPGWGQASQGVALQQFMRQAGPSPRYGARLNRSTGRRFNPPYPASTFVPPVAGGNQRASGRTMLRKRLFYADL